MTIQSQARTRLDRGSGPHFSSDVSDSRRRRWLQDFANQSLLAKATDETVEILLSHSTFSEYPAGAMVIDETATASRVFFVLDGAVRVFQDGGNGREYTPKLFCAPTHFGDLGALSGLEVNRSSAQAVNRVVTGIVPIEVVRRRLEEDHGLCYAWLLSVSKQHSITIDSDRQSVFGGVSARIANVMLAYADVFGSETPGRTVVDYPLSYGKLAQHAGCSRRSAISITQRLHAAGLLEHTQDGWCVDTKRLREELLPGHLGIAHAFDGFHGE